ncbi:uncharacterized protein LOC111888756 isoform X1 [Lactuca sativa]|uniref:Uncharacterized protein n=1 Tax=Lactuca sativa TaxID=4236 RepID=A0A9R1WEV6_LACSA|nr:uncharacterized protein LOC111888756 isoform X1 [Lactuca sativa]XP_042754954.1 uncharacterized protein LOC111888756 isoform X1 [Lactuca sativa]KAJ0221220.1 hypothetical protein LSAT_V11C200054950 [Lactuca sativa]
MGKENTRFSATMRQTEDKDSDGISHKPSKKLKKLTSVNKIDESINSKRVKLPKKFFDECYTVNHAPIPRKLRSAIKQRHYDSLSPSFPNPKDGILRLELPLESHNKKLKVNKDERQHSIISGSISEQITKDEEEAIAGLLLLAGNNKRFEFNLKKETSNSEEDLVENDLVIEEFNKSTNTVDVKKDCKDFRDGNVSRMICSRHVYICRIIQKLKVTEGKTVNSHEESKSETIKESCMKAATNQTSFLAAKSNQVSVPPYFGSPLYDPSQWPRPPKHQMLNNPFMAGSCYQNWQISGHDNNALVSVIGSKENGGLFLVDSSPILNLRFKEHGSDRNWLNDL